MQVFENVIFYYYLEFTLCKAEDSLQRMELQEKEEEESQKQTSELFRKNLKIKKMFINSRSKTI